MKPQPLAAPGNVRGAGEAQPAACSALPGGQVSKTRSSLLQWVSGRQTEQSQVHKHSESLRDNQEGRLGVWIDRTYSRGSNRSTGSCAVSLASPGLRGQDFPAFRVKVLNDKAKICLFGVRTSLS